MPTPKPIPDKEMMVLLRQMESHFRLSKEKGFASLVGDTIKLIERQKAELEIVRKGNNE